MACCFSIAELEQTHVILSDLIYMISFPHFNNIHDKPIYIIYPKNFFIYP